VLAKNPATVIRLSNRRESKRKRQSWTVDEARQFLGSARRASDVLYTAYVLVLVLGLRRGELLGLTWELVDLDAAQLYIGEQVQRVGGQLVRRQTKTEESEAPLPLPDLCIAALKLRKEQQDADRDQARDAWIDTRLVFTTRHGTPIEPRNFQPQLRPPHRQSRGAQDHRARHPENLRPTSGGAGGAPSGGNADPPA
jgi:integrase